MEILLKEKHGSNTASFFSTGKVVRDVADNYYLVARYDANSPAHFIKFRNR